VKALSVAFGVFMGIVPIWGFQLAVAIPTAMVLKLNKALVILAAHVSIPPMIPVLLFASHRLGRYWMGSRAETLSFSREISIQSVQRNFEQYLYGSLSLAVLAAVGAGLVAFFLLKGVRRKGVGLEKTKKKGSR